MAYTNAVYYMDYVLGSDAARAAQNIVSSTFTTPIEITIVGHGLVTGAIVTVAGHLVNTDANGTWKITWIDANTFSLDTSVGNGIGGATGTVTPFGGMSWADAWKSITGGVAGAIAAHIAAGDIIRLAKSTDPVAIGDATWNNLSKTITLAAAQTLNIDLCEVAWTKNPAGDTTVTRTAVATDGKEGSYCMKIALDAAVQVSIMQAYYATGGLDLSAYQKISFWIKNEAAIVVDSWEICLCSDVAGATVVDHFSIPAIPSTARWLPLTLARDGGGNLGNAIQSIAIWSHTTAPAASKYVYIDDFIACTTLGLNLQSLISKNSLAQGGTEGYYGIQSINGVTVKLDNDTYTKGDAGRGYSGTTELVATYIRETIKTDLAATSTTSVQQVQASGSLALGNIQFQCGYDTVGGTQNGETFFDGLNGNGYGIYLTAKSYITLNYLCTFRYGRGVFFSASNNNVITTLSNANNNGSYGVQFYLSNSNVITTLSNANNNGSYGVHFYLSNGNTITTLSNANNNGSFGGYIDSSNNNVITTLSNANNNGYYGIYISYSNGNTITTISNANNNTSYGVHFDASNNNVITTISNANNNTSYGIYFGGTYSNNNVIRALSTTGNGIAGIFNDKFINYLNKAVIAEATEVAGMVAFANSRIFSQMHDNTPNNHWIFTDGGLINSEANTRPGGLGLEWKLAILSSDRSSFYPLCLSIAKFAVVANKLVTFKVYLTKSHATDIAGYIVCKGGQLLGVPADVVATKANDVNPEQLTITFTPTEAGTVEIMACAYYVAANGNVLADTISIAQAT